VNRRLKRAGAWAATRFPWLVDAFLVSHPIDEVASDAFAACLDDVSTLRLALVTTGGAHLRSQPAFDLDLPDGDATWRALPSDAAASDLAIAHEGYDTRDAKADPNVVAPLDRLRELRDAGRIGSLVAEHVGLMGHIEDGLLDELQQRTVPEVVAHLKAQGAEAVLLAPT